MFTPFFLNSSSNPQAPAIKKFTFEWFKRPANSKLSTSLPSGVKMILNPSVYFSKILEYSFWGFWDLAKFLLYRVILFTFAKGADFFIKSLISF